jgi:nucleoid-associated protein YgaU
MAKSKKKGILDKAIDAVTTRDEKETATAATKAADAARRQATVDAAKREAAEAKARAAEAKLKEAEAKIKAAEKAAAEAKAKAEQVDRQAKARAEREQMRELLEQQKKEREEAMAARVYVVKSGDSLSKIAKEVLGDAGRWPEIFELNKDQIKDPSLIYPGQELKMPS